VPKRSGQRAEIDRREVCAAKLDSIPKQFEMVNEKNGLSAVLKRWLNQINQR
jgi:hypothetical protein